MQKPRDFFYSAIQCNQLRLILHYKIYALLPQKLATAYRAKGNIPVCRQGYQVES